MNDELKPCPFCGNKHGAGMGIRVGTDKVYCQCGVLKPAHGWNARPIEDSLCSQLADAQAEVSILKGQLEEAGKALLGLGYTPSSDDSGSYDSLIPDEYL